MPAQDVLKSLEEANLDSSKEILELEVLENKHLNERDFFTLMTEKNYGEQKYDGQSIPGHKKSKSNWFPMNELGESTDQILNHLLGKKTDETKIYYQENQTLGRDETEIK